MTKVNTDKAISFVQASGDRVLSAMALFVAGKMDIGRALDAIKAYQRDDGGWTKVDKDFQGDLSIITATSVALQWLVWRPVPRRLHRGSAVLVETFSIHPMSFDRTLIST